MRWFAWWVLVALSTFALLTHTCGPARAETTTERALRVLCGERAVHLAQHVDEAARRYLHHPVTLVAVMRKESHCKQNAMGKANDTGLMQLRGVARNGHSRAELLADARLNILTGARWLAMAEVWCGGDLLCALGVYNTGKRGKGNGYARRVWALVMRARKAIMSDVSN